MSRTYKDKPWRVKNPEAYDWYWGTEKVPYEKTVKHWKTNDLVDIISYWYRELPGVKTKKKKNIDCEWHWMQSTPSWWTRMQMNRPARREAHLLEHEASRMTTEELEDFDIPNRGKKPHIYYW